MDFTNYDRLQLEALLMLSLDETTTPVTETDDDGEIKVIVPPVFKCGIGFDTESSTLSHIETKGKKAKTIVDSCFCYTYQISIGEHYAVYRTIEQFLTFFSVLKSVVEYKNMDCNVKTRCIIWVANLAHEWSFIKYYMFDNFAITKLFAKTARDPLYIAFGEIEFRECIGLFGHSLADIAKNWSTTQKLKGDLDYNKIRVSSPEYCTPLTDEEKQYCINDVLILSEMHTAVLKAYEQPNGAVCLPYTSSGFVRMRLKDSIRESEQLTDEFENVKDKFRKPPKTNFEYLKRKNSRVYIDNIQWNICRKYGFCGGLCGSNINHVGKILKNVTCADLTSDYPAQMLHRNFPAGWISEKPIKYYSRVCKQDNPYFIIALVDFESKSNHAVFSKHKIMNLEDGELKDKFGAPKQLIIYNGKVLRAKNCVVCINDVDIKAYNMIYKLKVSPLKLWVFDKYAPIPDYLAECVKTAYRDKAVLKRDGLKDTLEYKDSKKVVNSLYGVLATKTEDTFEKFCVENGLFDIGKETTFKDIKFNTWLNPYIAFWVTSYARRILMYFISKYPEYIIQYDTDSLYYLPCPELEKELDEYNKKQIEINKSVFKDCKDIELLLDLGCWDIEEPHDKFLALGAKKYLKQDGDTITTVIAGLPKNAIPAEIAAENIHKPLTHYNPVVKWVKEQNSAVIVKHMFAHKFASDYNDDSIETEIEITDYLGHTVKQKVRSWHALKPIDFTLSIGETYLKHILNIDKKPLF